jgi:hypothetical protein
VASLVACNKNEEVDYCGNHYEFHANHLDASATLTIDISESGDLDGSLMIPDINYGDETEASIRFLLDDPDKIFTLQTETPCAVSVTGVSSSGEGLETKLVASCGPDNKLGQINVALFEHMPNLEELVVSVTTPATTKRFGISRQCDGPIFRLD